MKKLKLNCKLLIITLSSIVLFTQCACTKTKVQPLYPIDNNDQHTYTYNWAALADSLQNKLQSDFLAQNGKYYAQDNAGNQTFHYWHNAHAVDVLVDAYERTGNDVYMQRINNLLTGMRETNPVRRNTFINDFYDDMGWLGLSTLRAYDLSKNTVQLDIVKTLWQDILTGINDIQGRSLGWAKHRLYFKNTPANGPAIIMGLRLARSTGEQHYKDTAVMLYDWLRSNLVDPVTGIVWDGVNPDNQGGMEKAIYTYNQGLFIGAALEMYADTKNKKYLDDAVKTARTSMRSSQVAPGGILKPEGQGDGGLFKGIFVRYFVKLVQNKDLSESDKKTMVNFLLNNAKKLNNSGVNHQTLLISPDWNSLPAATIDLSTQLSGMMLIEAMASLQKEGIVQ